MTLTTPQRHNLKALALCALYAFVLLFFLSPDSYIYDIYMYQRLDSAAFFMCGKAWMNGMTPYVDFADSKGPLLWLIYGIGYLLNHHSYVGVFWISVLFYTATLYIAYKLSRLFLDPRPAALCVSFLPLTLFCCYYHLETRAEDFCYTFVMLSLYGLCRIISEGKSQSARSTFWLSLGMGISFACCLLIKWNIAVMTSSIMLVALILSIKHKSVLPCLGGMIVGCVLIALPFLIYFICFADFDAFIHEYFLNTFVSMDGRTNLFSVATIRGERLIMEMLTILLLIGTTLFIRRDKRFAWLLFCLILFRLGLGCVSPKQRYYFTILMPFTLFSIIWCVSYLLKTLSSTQRHLRALYAISIIAAIVCNIWHVILVHYKTDRNRQDYYKIAYVISQRKNAKVFYATLLFNQVTTPVDALPACRYWIPQAGMTEEMVKQRDEVMEKGLTDFIVIHNGYQPNETKDLAKLAAKGFVRYVVCPDIGVSLYGRPGLQLPPDDFYVSQWDVWLKRNIFGI